MLSYLLIMDIELVENMFELVENMFELVENMFKLVENMFDDYSCYLLMGAWLYCMHAG